MSLFDFVMTMNNCTFAESVQFLESYFHIGMNFQRGFGRPKREEIDSKALEKGKNELGNFIRKNNILEKNNKQIFFYDYKSVKIW